MSCLQYKPSKPEVMIVNKTRKVKTKTQSGGGLNVETDESGRMLLLELD